MLIHQPEQEVIHGNTALGRSCHHSGLHLRRLALTDKIADRRCRDHNLAGEDPALAARTQQQLLGKHSLQRGGQLHTNLRLTFLREHADHTVDGINGGIGMQGGKNKVAGLRCHESRLDGLRVSHLTDQNDIGILTEYGAQSVIIASRVLADLPLVDDALIRFVDVLDRVLQRDDMFLPCMIDAVQERSQRGRFTTSRLTRYQDDALVVAGEIKAPGSCRRGFGARRIRCPAAGTG